MTASRFTSAGARQDYQRRRGEIAHYFDRTAAEAWARLTSDAPVSGIRATVRAGRDRMRGILLGWLPQDLSGLRVLDAGCGTGALAAEAAARGAEVLAIDLSPTLVALAQERLPVHLQPGQGAAGSVRFASGDMLDAAHGTFDFAVGMDSLIHYSPEDAVRALAALAPRCRQGIFFTFAPRTPALAALHAVGSLFPRSDRAPSIVPVAEHDLRRTAAPQRGHAGLAGGPNRARQERLLHVAGDGAARTMKRLTAWIGRLACRLPAPLRKRVSHERWLNVSAQLLPFADAGSGALPLSRLLRLSLFQVAVGMATALIVGTLNRVLIVEMGVAAWLVSAMVALPILAAPFPGADRPPFRQPPLGPRLEAGSLPLDGHHPAVSAAWPSCPSRCWCSAKVMRACSRCPNGWGRGRRHWPSCCSAPVCRPCRRRAWHWQPTWHPRTPAPVSSRCST